MDKEEREKYNCVKDKENLEKAQKSGKSFMYLSQKSRKDLYIDKYNTDPTIYIHSEMKTWLHENFIDNCKPSSNP